jgi:hypothetical protein
MMKLINSIASIIDEAVAAFAFQFYLASSSGVRHIIVIETLNLLSVAFKKVMQKHSNWYSDLRLVINPDGSGHVAYDMVYRNDTEDFVILEFDNIGDFYYKAQEKIREWNDL